MLSPRIMTSRHALALALIMVGGAASAAAALADGPTFSLGIRHNAQLLPTLDATELLDAAEERREYDYVTKGYFKVGGRTVARLPVVGGHVDSTRERLTLTVKRSTRGTIRAAAKRRGSRRVVLTLVHQLTLTTNIVGDMAARTKTISQDAYLVIPRR
ncbi:MAG TPA: hypothetical protein VGR11_01820 [Solirubrobacteraceae bacterium]|nr:hypothetical protein [Solirubrobacteraceae bacterium]